MAVRRSRPCVQFLWLVGLVAWHCNIYTIFPQLYRLVHTEGHGAAVAAPSQTAMVTSQSWMVSNASHANSAISLNVCEGLTLYGGMCPNNGVLNTSTPLAWDLHLLELESSRGCCRWPKLQVTNQPELSSCGRCQTSPRALAKPPMVVPRQHPILHNTTAADLASFQLAWSSLKTPPASAVSTPPSLAAAWSHLETCPATALPPSSTPPAPPAAQQLALGTAPTQAGAPLMHLVQVWSRMVAAWSQARSQVQCQVERLLLRDEEGWQQATNTSCKRDLPRFQLSTESTRSAHPSPTVVTTVHMVRAGNVSKHSAAAMPAEGAMGIPSESPTQLAPLVTPSSLDEHTGQQRATNTSCDGKHLACPLVAWVDLVLSLHSSIVQAKVDDLSTEHFVVRMGLQASPPVAAVVFVLGRLWAAFTQAVLMVLPVFVSAYSMWEGGLLLVVVGDDLWEVALSLHAMLAGAAAAARFGS